MDKNVLTTESGVFYTESLKTTNTAFAPVRYAFFLYPYMGEKSRKYIEYRTKSLLVAFSDSPALSFLRRLLRKTNKMTNTIISKISEVRYILDAIYANTDSQHLAMRCSAVRKELADLIIEILDQEQIAAE